MREKRRLGYRGSSDVAVISDWWPTTMILVLALALLFLSSTKTVYLGCSGQESGPVPFLGGDAVYERAGHLLFTGYADK